MYEWHLRFLHDLKGFAKEEEAVKVNKAMSEDDIKEPEGWFLRN